jgi:hypothetical protein
MLVDHISACLLPRIVTCREIFKRAEAYVKEYRQQVCARACRAPAAGMHWERAALPGQHPLAVRGTAPSSCSRAAIQAAADPQQHTGRT